MKTDSKNNHILIDFLNAYNNAFYLKDIEKLRPFYDSANNRLIYLDNHKNNDTFTLDRHLDLLSEFFKNGKSTESGDVEPITIENLNIFQNDQAACLCYIARYKSFPEPAVRCTLYLEYLSDQWKIIHVHCSFQPS